MILPFILLVWFINRPGGACKSRGTLFATTATFAVESTLVISMLSTVGHFGSDAAVAGMITGAGITCAVAILPLFVLLFRFLCLGNHSDINSPHDGITLTTKALATLGTLSVTG